MPESYIGFVDVGFLHAVGANVLGQRRGSINSDAATTARWLRDLSGEHIVGQSFLRAYWYDGAFDPSHRDYRGQRTYFNGIAATPGIQLRLGHVAERPNQLAEPIRRAIADAAKEIGSEPSRLLEAFDRLWTFRPERQQKGVDTLIALDIVRLASRSVYSTAVLIAGDRDLAEAIRTAQDHGVRIIIATPDRQSVAQEVSQLDDDIIDIPASDVRSMFRPRQQRTNQ